MGISISNTYALRIFYAGNKNYVVKSNRQNATTGTLSFADSSALRTGIRRLQGYNWNDATEEDGQKNLKAFVDTYNSTLESASKYAKTDRTVKSSIGKIKKLTNNQIDELSSVGISVDKKTGYMSVSDTALKNLNRDNFTDYFNKDNEYLNDTYSLARHIMRRVDVKL